MSSNQCIPDPNPDIATAVLFPWLSEFLGIATLFALSRNPFPFPVPYTALMFLEGLILGILFERTDLLCNEQLGASLFFWINIDPEVLLLVFIPGILFGDALFSNYYLFKRSLWQSIFLAFPGMLFGTALTAVLAFFGFVKFHWSFPLAMLFGSILSATDPVSVLSLLAEVAAPPRLQMIISGESMLNDASAIVFFSIFKVLYFGDVGIDDIAGRLNTTSIVSSESDEISVGRGFALFFEEAVGGLFTGVVFGLLNIYFILKLNRRFEEQDAIMEVALTITSAYMTFYVAQIVLEVSGVIAVLFCAIITSAFARQHVNNPHFLHSTWRVVDFMGNTLLFTLAGVVFGSLISDASKEISGIHYLYLIFLYFGLLIIRLLLIFLSAPILAYTGLKSNPMEMLFMTWAGLRGAVGLALALALDNEVQQIFDEVTTFEGIVDVDLLNHVKEAKRNSTEVFFLMGGIALLTLVINGSSASYLLNKLGLVKVSESKEDALKALEEHMKRLVTEKFASVSMKESFLNVKFYIVKRYVSILETVTEQEVEDLVKDIYFGDGQEENYLRNDFSKLSKLTLYEKDYDSDIDEDSLIQNEPKADKVGKKMKGFKKLRAKIFRNITFASSVPNDEEEEDIAARRNSKMQIMRQRSSWIAGRQSFMREYKEESTELREVRLLFLDLMKSSYWDQIHRGYLFYQYPVYTLLQSVELTIDEVKNGKPIHDWKNVRKVSNSVESKLETVVYGLYTRRLRSKEEVEYQNLRWKIFEALSFVQAHHKSQKAFRESFKQNQDLTNLEEKVFAESSEQIKIVETWLKSIDREQLKLASSQIVAAILLNYEAKCIEGFKEEGLLTAQDATEMFSRVSRELNELTYSARSRERNETSNEVYYDRRTSTAKIHRYISGAMIPG